jgi:hypothetical protein
MPILLACPCGKRLRVRDELVGKRVRCPVCQNTLTVSEEQARALSEEPEVATLMEEQRPAERRPRRTREEDEADEEEVRPRRRRREAADEIDEDEVQVGPAPDPAWQRVLRILVLAFGVLGGAGAGFLGVKWLTETKDPKTVQEVEQLRNLLFPGAKGPAVEKAREVVDPFDKKVRACYFLLGGAPLGLAAGVLAFFRLSPAIAGVLMVAAAAGPAVLDPFSLAFTCPFLVGGVLAFLVKPKARARRPSRRRRPRP